MGESGPKMEYWVERLLLDPLYVESLLRCTRYPCPLWLAPSSMISKEVKCIVLNFCSVHNSYCFDFGNYDLGSLLSSKISCWQWQAIWSCDHFVSVLWGYIVSLTLTYSKSSSKNYNLNSLQWTMVIFYYLKKKIGLSCLPYPFVKFF